MKAIAKESGERTQTLVWKGQPAVGVLALIYSIIAVALIAALDFVKWYFRDVSVLGSRLFPSRLHFGGMFIPYPLEILTGLIVFTILLAKLINLLILSKRNKYELYEDGLYLNLGIVNLENIYVSPMAFSDARLFRPWTMRLVNRGQIIIDANDRRQFKLQYIKNPVEVQSLIRRTLAHPTVRIEQPTGS